MAHRAHRRFRRELGGFSLLEVLVAFVLLALVLGALLRVFGQGLNSAAVAEEYAQAALLAESKLATLGAITALQPGVQAGTFDPRFRWEAKISTHEQNVATGLPATLLQIELTVRWPSGARERQLTLTTLRLVGG
jgi:general secretion pathway protein I